MSKIVESQVAFSEQVSRSVEINKTATVIKWNIK